MTDTSKPQLNLGQKLGISLAVAKAVSAALVRLTTSPFRGQKGGPTYYRDVMYAMLRTQLRSLSIEQAQFLNKSTSEVYFDFAKASGFTPVTEELANGAKAHWLGDRSAKVTLVYLHGGGYAQPATAGHLAFLNDLAQLLSINVVVLAYTLAPQAEYPTQLIQAATLLAHLLTTKSASDLILAGDSAGGNLALGLVSHLLHPHAKAPRVDLAGASLRGLLLISPWVSFDTRHPSYTANAESDIFDHVPLDAWSRAFLGASQRHGILQGDSYSEPLVAEPSWWSGAHALVDEVYVWGGGGELFIDGIKAFADKFADGWRAGGGSPSKVQVVSRDRMCHEAMVVDILIGYKEKGAGAKDIENFVRSKL